jgi:pilus assembly protein FimV
LPDFDDTDFSDMFKEELPGTDANQSSDIPEIFDEPDTALSTDELANLTNSDDFKIDDLKADDFEDISISDNFDFNEPMEEIPAESDLETLKADDFSEPDTDVTEDFTTETETAPVADDAEISESKAETFEIPETAPAVETSSSDLADFSLDDIPDGEINLDDFMDGGFSDESVAAGNNGFASDAPVSISSAGGDSEDISLDDFLGEGFSDAPVAVEQPKEDVIVDEPPIEMDLNFDDSVEDIQTEENVSIDSDYDIDENDYSEPSEEINFEEVSEPASSELNTTEDISLDDFTAPSESTIETESVDLSDFGIEEDAEETPVTQNVEDAKKKEDKVDFDLFVGDSNAATAPVVNEIKTDSSNETVEESENQNETPVTENISANSENANITNTLLQQIFAEITSIKNDVSQLKSDYEEFKTSTLNAEKTLSEEIKPEDEKSEEDNGFFAADDGDDTIALSFDELDNIMNTAEINAETSEPATEELAEETPALEETDLSDNFVSPEASDYSDLPEEISIPIHNEVSEEITEEPVIEEVSEITTEEPTLEDISEISADEPTIEEVSEVTTDEPVIEDISEVPADEPVIEDITEVSTDEPVIEEVSEVPADEPTIEEVSEITTEEPVIEEVSEVTADEPVIEDISEVSTDEPVIEDITEISTEEPVIEDITEVSTDEPVIEDISEITTEEPVIEEVSEITSEEPVIEEVSEVSTDEPVIEDITEVSTDEPVIEDITEVSTDEPVIEEISEVTADEPTIEEVSEITSEEPVIEDISEVSTDEPVIEEVSEVSTDEPVIEDITEVSTDEPVIEEVSEEIAEEPAVDESIFVESEENKTAPLVSENTDFSFDDIENTLASVDDITTVQSDESSGIVSESFDDVDELSDVLDSNIDTAAENVSVETVENSEPVIEETAVPESEVNTEPADFGDIDELNNDITESNIDYLTAKDEESDKDNNADLKKDIKSVLLYMDQLLENLPEDKIIEFANSEEFVTYKKLFSKLGLS